MVYTQSLQIFYGISGDVCQLVENNQTFFDADCITCSMQWHNRKASHSSQAGLEPNIKSSPRGAAFLLFYHVAVYCSV